MATRCTPIPGAQHISQDQADQIIKDLQLAETVQLPASLQRRGLLASLRAGWTAFRQGWNSPSFLAEKDPAFKAIVDQTGMTSDHVAAFWDRLIREWNASPASAIRQGTPESALVGSVLNTPGLRANKEFMGKLPAGVRTAVEFIQGRMDAWADALGLTRQQRIQDYFPHFFDRKTIRNEAALFIEQYKNKTLPPELMADAGKLLSSYERVIYAIDNNENLATLGLPNQLGRRYLEQRTGASGYTLDGVKAFNSYAAFFEKKFYWNDQLLGFRDNVLKIKDEGLKAMALDYLRDNLGRQPISATTGVDQALKFVRSLEFHRTIGFGNIGSAFRNAGQTFFTLTEGGPRAYREGTLLMVEATRHPDGYLGQLMRDEGVAVNLPNWLARQNHSILPATGEKLLRASGLLFNIVERALRKQAFMVGVSQWFRGPQARQLGLTLDKAIEAEAIPREAIEYARQFIRKTQFKYGAEDMPFILRDEKMNTLFQYSSYTIKAGELMWKWLVREGNPGRAKLAMLLGFGLGTTALADTAGFDVSRLFGVPMDLLEAVQTIKSAGKGDWAEARAHASKTAVGGLTGKYGSGVLPSIGPTAQAVVDIGGIAGKVYEDAPTSKAIWKFMAQDVTPIEIRRIYKSYLDFLADPNSDAVALMDSIIGFPNAATRARMMYLDSISKGQEKKAQAILQEYRNRQGGAVPVDMKAVAKARIEHIQEKMKERIEQAKETPRQKLRRLLPAYVEREVL